MENQDKALFQDAKPEERPGLLDASAFSVEEMEVFREELATLSIDLSGKREAAAAKIKELREEIRSVEREVKSRVEKLRMRYEQNLETVYLYDYQEENRMLIYNKMGHVVSDRPLLPHERQTKIVSMRKTGTNG